MLVGLKAILFGLLLASPAIAEPVGHGIGGGSVIPVAAAGAGYTINTFHIPRGGFSAANVDVNETFVHGYQIYGGRFFTTGAYAPFAGNSTFNADGSITVFGEENRFQIATAAQVSGSPPWVGTVFGCGAYITAEISMNESQNESSYQSYWYADAIEQLAYPFGSSVETWPGQATDYTAFVEVDTMENFGLSNLEKQHYYTTLHNWYGTRDVTCPAYCEVSNSTNNGNETFVPKYTDFTQYHRIAVLWIPATLSANGSISFWFDDEMVNGPYPYAYFDNSSPPAPPPTSPFIFSILDQRHLALIAGGGNLNPVTLFSMDVWQGSGSCNLTN